MEIHTDNSFLKWFSLLLSILICQSSTSLASTTDPFVHYAESILYGMDLLEDKTENLVTVKKVQKRLKARLKAAKHQINSGIDKYQKGKKKKAIKRFKKSRHFINLYLKILSENRQHYMIPQLVVGQLKADVKKIRADLILLINGDFGNSAPIANAGLDQSVVSGQTVTLDGSASSDSDGDVLQMSWTISSQPASSNVTLNNPLSLTPSFTPVIPGTYTIELIVSDSQSSSVADTVIINISVAHINTAPVANAGLDQSVFTSQQVMLDGSGSSDVDGDALTWLWNISTKPPGSNAVLSSNTAVQPTFDTDFIGQYIVQLIVNDGTDNSDPDNVIINALLPNTLPVANAGTDQTGFVGSLITLDGGASSDADGDILSHLWSLISVPTNSQAVLDNAFITSPSFLLDSPGDYIAQLIVNDGQANSQPDEIIVSTVNSRPLANAGADQTHFIVQQTQLDGSASTDADGDALTYLWSITSQPANSTATLSNAQNINPVFTADQIGFYVFQLIVNDSIIDSTPATMTLQVNPPAPLLITLDAPADQLFTNQADINFSGSLNHSATLTINNQSIMLQADLTFNHPVTLQQGLNNYTLQATDAINAQYTLTRQITLDTAQPATANLGFISVNLPDTTGQTTITGEPGSVEAFATVHITNLRTNETTIVTADANGAFSAQLNGQAADSYSLVVQDAAGNQSAAENVNDGSQGSLPPDPASIAPALNPTISTSHLAATAFLYTGSNLVQTGVAANTIELKRSAVIRGKINDNQGQPLSGVNITIKNHPEFGQTLSRSDGGFDMVVNGGGLLTINYEKLDYLPVQRQINVPWNDYAILDDIVMIQLDSRVTSINLADNTQAFQIARGNPVTDADGTRQATILFPQGTTATITLPDGTSQTLSTINVRATEYTVGDNGPAAMPGELPPQSAYTYAVELSLDEAIAAGASRVDFNQPLPVYIDNFLGFPAGEVVPSGWYDREKSAWIPSDNGLVIDIIAINNGMAELDIDGSGTAANATALAVIGISDAERTQLASLYQAGNSLWRVPVTHFTPWDCNWPFGPPPDATPPPPPPVPDLPPPDEDEECVPGCIIQPLSQSLGEKLPVTGTPFDMVYQSERMAGNVAARTLNIPISGATVPGSLRGIDLTITIAGQVIRRSFPSTANQNYRFVWDGMDVYGRAVALTEASIRVDYRYQLVYYPARQDFQRAFGRVMRSGGSFIGNRGTSSASLSRQWQRMLTGIAQIPSLAASALGGWGLDMHHAYNANTKTLFLGDGSVRLAQSFNSAIITMAGTGVRGYSGDGGPADQARLHYPKNIAFDSDGSLYIADSGNHRIRRIAPDGIITTVTGRSGGGDLGDGGPADQARLWSPNGIALDSDGGLYIADSQNHRIRHIASDGIITTVAGTGTSGYSGDGGFADQASLRNPMGVALGSDGSLYIADSMNNRIRRIAPDGIITTVAGTGTSGYSGDGGFADQAEFYTPQGIAFDSDGSLYITDVNNNRIRRVTPDGIITTVAGTGRIGYSGDGGSADQAMLSQPRDIALSTDGSFYIAGYNNQRIRRVAPDGIITTVAGTGTSGYSGDGGSADQTRLSWPSGIAIGHDGSLYIVDTHNHRIRRFAPEQPGIGINDYHIPSNDANQLYHFNANGRHLRTLDTTTSTVLYQFRYDTDGYLIEIEDVNGDITRIERSGIIATAIIAPDGQRTSLAVDANGYLNKVTDPAGYFWQMGYTANGLMTAFIDRNANLNQFAYDADGRLLRDLNPISGGWQLARTEQENGYSVTMTSGEGRTSRYQVEHLPGDIRRQTTSAADGSVTVKEFNKSVTTTTWPDGTVARVTEGPDPRFSMQAPVDTNLTIQTPAGLNLIATTERTATLSNENDLLSVITLTETSTINGRNSTSQYDAATLTWADTSAANRSSSVQINIKGQPVLSQITGLEQASYSYDIRGRLNVVIEGAGINERRTTLVYYQTGPMAGFLQSITNAGTQVTTFEYDAVGRVTKQIMPDNREINYRYDANGNLTSLTPPGRPAHVYLYNEVDQAKQYTPPSLAGIVTPQTVYAYNLDKDLTQVTRPDGQTVSLNYGVTTGKLDSMTIPTGNYSYSYNATSGQLNSITAPDNGVLSYSYDGFLTKNSTLTGAVSGSIDRVYDNDFRITARSINGANSISYQYDDDSLLILAGSLSINREAQKAGIINGTTLGNLTTTRTYTGFAELVTFDASYNTTSLFNTSYTRDKLGRITQKIEAIESVSTTTDYDYDLSGRLFTETTGGSTTSYTYDANGNRTHINGSIVGDYDDQDRLTSYAGASYQYTDNGELHSKIEAGQTTNYLYDVLGNLRQVTLLDTTQIDYVIDGQNRRIGKKINDVLVRGFLYKDQLNPIAELDGNNQIVSRFIYGTKVNVPDYMLKGTTTYRIISDHLGSPRLVIDTATGAVAQRIDYDTWGNITADSNPGFQPFGFAGGLYDQHTQLTRFGARDYDAWAGRWTVKDPIGFGGGDTNLYGYTFKDPINFTDPNGLCGGFCVGGIVVLTYLLIDTAIDIANGFDEATKKNEQYNNELQTIIDMANGKNTGASCPDAQATRGEAFKAIGNTAEAMSRLPGTTTGGSVPTSIVEAVGAGYVGGVLQAADQ